MHSITASILVGNLILAMLAYGVVWCWAKVLQRGGVGRCLPRAKLRAVPWGTWHILLIFVAWQGMDAFMVRAFAGSNPSLSPFQVIRATAVSRAILIILLPVLLYNFSGALPYQMGLTVSHWRRDLRIGLAAFIMVTPLVYGIQIGVLKIVQNPQTHEIEQMLQDATASRMALAVLTATVLAPAFEELLFRGILLPWMRHQPAAAPGTLVSILGFVLIAGSKLAADDKPSHFAGLISMAVALGFGLVTYAVHLRRPALGAILGSSILFALVHIHVWPTPIPIFGLALALGLLAYRTQSLVAPIILHSAFNSLGTIGLLIRVLSRQPGLNPSPEWSIIHAFIRLLPS